MDGLLKYNTFLAEHKPQLVLSGVPEHFWPTICKKLTDQIFDAGLSFQLAAIEYEDGDQTPYDPLWSVFATRDIQPSDPSHVYLIDHAWTFKANSIRSNLRNVPGLLGRMCNLMQITANSVEEQIEEVCKSMWKYAHTYTIGGSEFSVEERIPMWYVMDELGSGIIHSDNYNFRAVPFIHIPEQLTYTLLFPVKDVAEGCPITRNFVEGDYTGLQREAMLLPWEGYCEYEVEIKEPSSKYFLEGHIVESVPAADFTKEKSISGKLKVYSEYEYVNQYLTHPEFEIVDNETDADILWYINHFKDYKELSENSPHKFVNQFPFEYVVTIKDLLALVARRCSNERSPPEDEHEDQPVWFPTTFNMKTELYHLVTNYMRREQAGLDNHWICKPYNLARGLDTYITDNVFFLCRLPLTGPKIAQKYISNPVLFDRPDIGLVKFDIRYVILLKSVNPTEVYVYSNFFLRFSNKPFALNDFEDYEKHFTVMNYNDGAPLFRLLCADFKEAWSKQYPNHDWVDVEKSIFSMLSELFSAATSKDPPRGIGKSPQSRALYAADIMLSWQGQKIESVIQPKLLEINWMPDCQRACEYYPDFYNDIFSAMFLDKDVNTCVQIL
ncbi:tubulin--tyrosine ligase-like protein 12 [Epargyreus clarus]|uniref:tubulin--tyrosine ligase-like protein 12 n=1 Tax=Epargyreus clarus TaxID=520877 RepID=UPI003C2C3518